MLRKASLNSAKLLKIDNVSKLNIQYLVLIIILNQKSQDSRNYFIYTEC